METLTRGGRMDLAERPICFSSVPPAFMTGQACHITHSDSVQQCPSGLMPALAQPARKNTLISSSLIMYLLKHINPDILLPCLVACIHFTEVGNVSILWTSVDMLHEMPPKWPLVSHVTCGFPLSYTHDVVSCKDVNTLLVTLQVIGR